MYKKSERLLITIDKIETKTKQTDEILTTNL